MVQFLSVLRNGQEKFRLFRHPFLFGSGHTRSVVSNGIGGGDERIIEEDRFVAAGQHIVWDGRIGSLLFWATSAQPSPSHTLCDFKRLIQQTFCELAPIFPKSTLLMMVHSFEPISYHSIFEFLRFESLSLAFRSNSQMIASLRSNPPSWECVWTRSIK